MFRELGRPCGANVPLFTREPSLPPDVWASEHARRPSPEKQRQEGVWRRAEKAVTGLSFLNI